MVAWTASTFEFRAEALSTLEESSYFVQSCWRSGFDFLVREFVVADLDWRENWVE